MVQKIRQVDLILGSRAKSPMLNELTNSLVARKSIVANKSIVKGEYFSDDNLTVLRPSSEISPVGYFDLLGNKVNKDY